MASKRGWSAGGGAVDIAYQMAAFEEMDSVTLTATLTVRKIGGIPSLQLDVTAFTLPTAGVAPAPLASSRFSLPQLRYKTVEDAITYALYQIDGKLAELEMTAPQPKDA